MPRGSFFIALSALIWGLFPIVTSNQGTSLHPLWNSSLATLIAVIPFAIVMWIRKRWSELRDITGIKYSLIAATLIGVIYYAMVFVGSSLTSPQNTAILLLLELVTTVILLAPIESERLKVHEIVGSGFLLLSAGLVLNKNLTNFTSGDWILISASVFTPYGNLYAKKARERVSGETFLFIRSLWSGLALLVLAYLFAPKEIPIPMDNNTLIVVVVSGLLLMGFSKLLWTEGIVHLKVATALAIYCALAPTVTFGAAYLIFHQSPTIYQMLALPLGIIGAAILFGFLKRPPLR